MLVEMGLDSAKEGYYSDGELQYRSVDGLRVLSVLPPDGVKTAEVFTSITDPERGIAAVHSENAPKWVSCPDKPALEALLAEHFECSVGKPGDVEETHWTLNGPPGTDSSKTVEEPSESASEPVAEAAPAPEPVVPQPGQPLPHPGQVA